MRKRFYTDAQMLIEGYGLISHRGERKVNLVGKPLASGNVSLVRYGCTNGKRVREYTGVILEVETSQQKKLENDNKVREQRALCDALNADLTRKEAGFAPKVKAKASLLEYVAYLKDEALKETGNKHSYYSTLNSLAKHIEIFDAGVKFGEVDLEWVYSFLDYLKRDALNINFLRAKDVAKRSEIHLSQNSQNRLIRNLNYVMNKAVRAGIIASNPMQGLDKKDKVSAKTGTRTYLTKDEVERLVATPYLTTNSRNVKEAFLFSCMTGLRYSDLTHLTLADFHKDEVGTYIAITMVKTKEPLKVYVPDGALRLIEGLGKGKGEPLFSLPKNDHANVCLQRWAMSAGIAKHVTFHCARHTAATLLLSSGLPIAVVSKQLGHLKIATTEIYAKIVDEAQVKAANAMDKMFNL